MRSFYKAFLVSVLGGVAAAAFSQPLYDVTPIEGLPLSSKPTGMNDLGDVVGITPFKDAFVYRGRQFTLLKDIVGEDVNVAGINDRNLVVGTLAASGQPFSMRGRKLTLLPLPEFALRGFSLGVNSYGVILGWVSDVNNTRSFGTWDKNVFSLINSKLLPGRSHDATAINDAGDITFNYLDDLNRWHTTLWDGTAFNELKIEAYYDNLRAADLNNFGGICGTLSPHGTTVVYPFVYEDGQFDILDVTTMGLSNGQAIGMNDNGDVVGTATGKSGQIGLLRRSGDSWLNINDLLSDESYTVDLLLDINNSGEMVGLARRSGDSWTGIVVLSPAHGN